MKIKPQDKPLPFQQECPNSDISTIMIMKHQDVTMVPIRQECSNSDHPNPVKPPKQDRESREVPVDTHEGGNKKSAGISDKLLPRNVVPHPQAEHLPQSQNLHNLPTPTPVLPKAENTRVIRVGLMAYLGRK